MKRGYQLSLAVLCLSIFLGKIIISFSLFWKVPRKKNELLCSTIFTVGVGGRWEAIFADVGVAVLVVLNASCTGVMRWNFANCLIT